MTKSVNITVRLDVAGWPICGTIQCELVPCPLPPPIVAHLVATKGSGSVAQRTVTINLLPPIDPTVTSIPFVVTGSSVAGQNPVTVDAFLATNSFQANDGDVVSLVGTQINPVGPSPPSVAVFATIAAGTLPVSPIKPVLPIAPAVANLVAV